MNSRLVLDMDVWSTVMSAAAAATDCIWHFGDVVAGFGYGWFQSNGFLFSEGTGSHRILFEPNEWQWKLKERLPLSG
jgi:hypothetical protein